MNKTTERYPFLVYLIKLSATIIVGWNAFVFASAGPFIFLFLVLLAIGSGAEQTADTSLNLEHVYGTGSQELRSIRITGVILGDRADEASPLESLSSGVTYGYDIKEQLYKAADDPLTKGIILEINSPGGTIYGAHAIADGVKYYKDKTKQPVYSYIQGIGASGAYWAAVATDKIFADYGSDVGSIGVIMGPFKYYDGVVSESGGLFDGGVVTQNGIETITLTAGKSKDVGNPYRRLTAEELKTLQTQVNNDYDVFVKYVSERRGIPDATIRNQIGAMAYDNKTAQELKLLDKTGSREDAYAALAEAAGVSDNYEIKREKSGTGWLYSLLTAFSHQPQRQAKSGGPCLFAQAHLAYSGNVSDLCTP